MEQERQSERKQELIFKLSMFEQQMNQLQEQIEAVERGINELGSLNFGLDEIKGSVGKEIMAPLGRGVFVKANMASEDLIVDIGGKNFVKKDIGSTKEIIEEQIKKLIKVKGELKENLEKMSEEMTETIKELQKEES